MSVSAPISSFQIPLDQTVGARESRPAGFFARLAAWLSGPSPSTEWDELAYANDQLLADMGFRPDARPCSRRAPMHAGAICGATRGEFYL